LQCKLKYAIINMLQFFIAAAAKQQNFNILNKLKQANNISIAKCLISK